MIIEIGVPVVTWSGWRSSEKTPERMRTASGSWRWVTNLPRPGRRFSSQTCTSASVSGMPGGQPSTTQPSAGPWLSPQVVTRNRCPKVLCDMAGLCVAAKPRGHKSGRAQGAGEEVEGHLQGVVVGRALRDGDLAEGERGAGLGAAGRHEVVVADAGQALDLGAGHGAGDDAAVEARRGHRVGLADDDAGGDGEGREAGRVEG